MLLKLSLVVPCYNEEAVLPITYELFPNWLRQLEQEENISAQSRVLFIDDGSKDETVQIAEKLIEKGFLPKI